jgi:hypothetical protein
MESVKAFQKRVKGMEMVGGMTTFSTDWIWHWWHILMYHCKEHRVYPLILRSYRLKLQCSNHHVQSMHFSALTHLAPISTHLSTPCPCWFTGKLSQLLWKRSLQTRARTLHIVTYILITQDHALFGSVPHTFTLIDTVYRDLTGLLVHTLRMLPTP